MRFMGKSLPSFLRVGSLPIEAAEVVLEGKVGVMATREMLFRPWTVLLAMIAALYCPSPGAAQIKPDAFDVKESYTKYEHYIPMRDGKRLFTAIHVPKDTSHPYPFLMMRTPYGVAPTASISSARGWGQLRLSTSLATYS